MAKKKYQTQGLKEVLRAQGLLQTQSNHTNELKNSLTLPIAEIKKDLIRTGLFVVAATIVLIILGITKFGYAQLSAIFVT